MARQTLLDVCASKGIFGGATTSAAYGGTRDTMSGSIARPFMTPKQKFISLTWWLGSGPTNRTSATLTLARGYSKDALAYGAVLRNSARIGTSIRKVDPLPSV